MDTSINGALFAEAGAWVAILRFVLFPLIRFRRRGPNGARTGRPYVAKEFRMPLVIAVTGAAFAALAALQDEPLREAIPAGLAAVSLAITVFKAQEGVRERRAER